MRQRLKALLVLCFFGFNFSANFIDSTQAAQLAECPVSLSNPDGQALDLEQYDLRIAVHGPLALVEMEMTFRNPQDRQTEGRFLYLLPPGATIARFAKDVNGQWMEGEVVERQRARSIYREILHTMRDPALLEQDQGNRFSVRVFPIPARSQTRLLLSYSQRLPAKAGARELVIPLAGMPQIERFSFHTQIFPFANERLSLSEPLKEAVGDAQADANQRVVLKRNFQRHTPAQDYRLRFTPNENAQEPIQVLSAGTFQMLVYRPKIEPAAPDVDTKWQFYFDTSASNADSFERKLQATELLFSRLSSSKAPFNAHAFDLETVELFSGQLEDKASGTKLVELLRARKPLGATDLAMALRQIGEQARNDPAAQRFVLVSDGIATWGDKELEQLLEALGAWPGNDTLHALVLGAKQDEKVLNALTAKGHGRVIALSFAKDLAAQARKAHEELLAPPGLNFECYDEGAAWIYPKTFRDVRPGDELIVFSKIENGKSKPGIVRLLPNGRCEEQTLYFKPLEKLEFAPLLQREAYAAYLNHLEGLEREAADRNTKQNYRQERLQISLQQRVLCSLTALLVLETEQDYERYGLDRHALSSILHIGERGIAVMDRIFKAPRVQPLPVVAVSDKPASVATKSKDADRNNLQQELSKLDADTIKEELGQVPNDTSLLADTTNGPEGPVESSLERMRASSGLDFPGPAFEVEALERRSSVASNQAGSNTENPMASPFVGEASMPPQPSQRMEENTSRSPAIPLSPPKRQMPAWTAQAGKLPTEVKLSELRKQIATKPLERSYRNRYTEALAQLKNWDGLLAASFEWLPLDSENAQVFEFIGLASRYLGDARTALRAYSSIVEIAPSDAALLGRAGVLLMYDKNYIAAEVCFREALKQRQDNPNLHRELSLCLWLKGDFEAAVTVLEDALKLKFNSRYGDLRRVLQEELGYVYKAWMVEKSGKERDELEQRIKRSEARLSQKDALRVTLAWETDANDVDLHLVDPNGEECFFGHKNTASGLELYSDQTQGLGPEVIRTGKTISGRYHLGVKYYNPGPMGVARGLVVIKRPQNGIVKQPEIMPFFLVPNDQNVRFLATLEF